MKDKGFKSDFQERIKFTYSCFDRLVIRGYIQGLFNPGAIIVLLRNLGFTSHSNGVIRLLADQLNSHIKKVAEKLQIQIHWWNPNEKKKNKEKYNSKIDLLRVQQRELQSQ